MNHDYRDYLLQIIEDHLDHKGITRYRLCKDCGLDQATLSNVLSKRRHFSIGNLELLVSHLGYEIHFRRAA